MSKLVIPNTVSRAFHKVGFKLKKHSPEILVVAGIVGVVASAVMACKATTKASGILEEAKEQIDAIHTVKEAYAEAPENTDIPYTEDDAKKDLTIVYAQTGIKFAKLYAPAVGLGILSIASILASTKIMHERNVALSAAYTTAYTGFQAYRQRVVDRFGKELDHELKYDIKAKEIEERVVDENGSEKTVTKTVNVADISEQSDYARFFDEYSPYWEKNSEYNLMFLRQQQNHANDMLKSQGFLFLNDVYAMLGIPKTKAGQIVGWIYDEKNPIGDNYVDFGMYDICNANKRGFVNGYERSILLDFNVDGNILEHI